MKIYLWIPSELAKRVKASDMDLSRICREALLKEVVRRDRQARRYQPYARLEPMRGRQP